MNREDIITFLIYVILLIVFFGAYIFIGNLQREECIKKNGIVVDNAIGLFDYCINEKEN